MSAVNHDLRVSSMPTDESRDGAALACDDGTPVRLALVGIVARTGSSSSSNLFRRWKRGVPASDYEPRASEPFSSIVNSAN